MILAKIIGWALGITSACIVITLCILIVYNLIMAIIELFKN